MSKSGDGAKNEVNTGHSAESVERDREQEVTQGASEALYADSIAKTGRASETAKPTEAQTAAERAKEIAEIQAALAKSAAAIAGVELAVQHTFEKLNQIPGFQRDKQWMEVNYPQLAALVGRDQQTGPGIQGTMNNLYKATNGDSKLS